MVAVWFAHHEKHLYVATSSRSRKARNISAKPKASLMIDVRGAEGRGVTASGFARVIGGQRSRELNARIYDRYLSSEAMADPRVGPVFAQWNDVTIEIAPSSWISWDVRVADREVFGGAFASSPDYMLPRQL